MDENNENLNPDNKEGKDKATGTDGNPTDGAGKKDGDVNNSIPKYRFDEVNEKFKAVKAELDAIKAEKAKEQEAEALKRGEHEKLLAQKDSELEAYKTKEAIRKQREEELTSKNNARVENLKASYGDKRGTVSNLLHDGDDAFITAKTLDAIEAMKPTKEEEPNKAPKWGSSVPDGNKQGRLAELKAKAEKGEYLSDRERKELYELVEGKK